MKYIKFLAICCLCYKSTIFAPESTASDKILHPDIISALRSDIKFLKSRSNKNSQKLLKDMQQILKQIFSLIQYLDHVDKHPKCKENPTDFDLYTSKRMVSTIRSIQALLPMYTQQGLQIRQDAWLQETLEDAKALMNITLE